MKANDLVEDREGDKAVVREVHDDGYVSVEMDCRPGYIARMHESRLSNISERVRELNADPQPVTAHDPRDLFVDYGVRPEKGYVLAVRGPSRPRTIVFQSDSKSEVIAEAQRRKGWEPVDGSEQTYGRQIGEHEGEARS